MQGNRVMQKLQSFDDLDLDSPTEEWGNNEHFAANIGSILRPGIAVVTSVQMAWHPQGKSAGSSSLQGKWCWYAVWCWWLLKFSITASPMHATPSSRC